MSVVYMQKCVNDFFYRINEMDKALSHFSGGINEKRSRVLADLEEFMNKCETINRKYHVTDDKKKTGVQRAVEEFIEYNQRAIIGWKENIKRNTEGQEFMNKNEKYLLTMVFGQVKTGKSSLGNFIAGKKFYNAKFDNEYKNYAHPVFCNEKAGREGNITVDDSGNQWFTEGVIDTTGAIQYFTLSGLRWLDSPGTGALKKAGDTDDFTMEQLVNDYIDYADLGIFLMNSSEPGLQADMEYIKKMMEKDKDVLVVITRSDRIKKKLSSDGEIIGKILCAKSDEDRLAQEEYITTEINNKYNISQKYALEKYKVLSISTALAAEAIEQQDDNLFKASNIDKFMNMVSSKISRDAVIMKEKNPKKNLNNFIDNIIKGYHSNIAEESQYDGINEIIEALDGVRVAAGDFKESISSKETRIRHSAVTTIKHMLQIEAQKWSSTVNQTDKGMSAEDLSEQINNIADSVIREELEKELKSIINDFRAKQISSIDIALNTGLKKEKEIVEHEYTQYVTVKRDASGIRETICSWFGKTYYRNKAIKKVMRQEVDLGTNLDVFIEDCVSAIESTIPNYIKNVLEGISRTYFAPQERYVSELQNELEALKIKLSNYKYKEI